MGSFAPITLEDRASISRYLCLFPQNETSEYTFTNLFIWSEAEQVQWLEGQGYMLLRARPNGALRHLMAFAPDERLGAALQAAIDSARQSGEPFAMHSLPGWYCDKMRELMPGRFLFEREPHMDDYVYNTRDLIELTGKKYHAKRNHINKFMSLYRGRFDYVPYEQGMADECMQIYRRWFDAQEETAPLRGERDSVRRALYNAKALEIVGGVILLDGVPQAFSLGERLTDDMAVIHIEKINMEIPELFSMINREFAEHAFSGLAWINREEDMGDEGLRRAKESYRPARMIEKYKATLA